MEPFEVLITKSVYDEDNNEKTPKVIFGPKLIFAWDKGSAIKKAVIKSKMLPEDIDDSRFYIKNFS